MRTLFLLQVFLALFLQSCQSQQQPEGRVDAATFNKQLSLVQNKVILDVRTPEEYAEGYIDKAVLMNYYDAGFGSSLKQLDKNKTYFVYCAAGGRSHSVMMDMQKAGFKHVIELDGGVDAWKAARLPLVKPK